MAEKMVFKQYHVKNSKPGDALFAFRISSPSVNLELGCEGPEDHTLQTWDSPASPALPG